MERNKFVKHDENGIPFIPAQQVEITSAGNITGAPVQVLDWYESSGLSPVDVWTMCSQLASYHHLGTPVEIVDRMDLLAGKATIDSFRGEYAFLSNFHPCKVAMDGLIFDSVEAAYQAAKCADESDRVKFVGLTAQAAKKLGRQVPLRKDWESVKYNIMKTLLYQKFSANRELRHSLLNTGNAMLEERNTWHDNYWGQCTCPKCSSKVFRVTNVLGALLMRTRTRLLLEWQPHYIPLDNDLALVMQPENDGLSVRMMESNGTKRALLELHYDPSELPGNQLMVELHLGGHPIKMYYGALGQED